jgi:hypothetical protein
MRIVATCTTLPNRYDTLLRTLKCLKNQDVKLDEIYVTLPYKAKRLNKIYPELPEEIKKLCKVVRVKEDYGPLCKLYGALISEHDDNTIIICVDDDCIYPFNLVSSLIKYHKLYPNVAICSTGVLLNNGNIFMSYHTNDVSVIDSNNFMGFNVPENGRMIDILYGFSGVLYKRSFFPNVNNLYKKLFKYPLIDDSIFCSDDIIISGYLKKNNIKIMLFKDIPSIIHDVKHEDSLSYDFFKMMIKFNKSIKILKDNGMFLTYEECSINESPVYRILLFTFLTILLIIFILLLKFYLNRKVIK